MKFVSFETATEWCSVALWLDGEVSAIEERVGHSHSERVLPMLDRLAAAAGIRLDALEAMAEECGAPRVVACLDARMGEVYYSALEKRGARWEEVVPAQCVAPVAAPRPPGEGWVGCGNGFAVYGAMGLRKCYPEIHPGAAALARLAAPRLAAGQGVDAARAAPNYLRDKVALTTEERRRR